MLADHRTAPIDAKLRATLEFLQKVTLMPDEVTAADAAAVRAAGVSDEAVRDALYVCFLFSIFNRLADTLHFNEPDRQGYKLGARVLLTIGYR